MGPVNEEKSLVKKTVKKHLKNGLNLT